MTLFGRSVNVVLIFNQRHIIGGASGDMHFVQKNGDNIHIAMIDGVGHGPQNLGPWVSIHRILK